MRDEGDCISMSKMGVLQRLKIVVRNIEFIKVFRAVCSSSMIEYHELNHILKGI